jgi:hypothetical protein
MSKFAIDKRYNHIGINFTFSAEEWDEIYDWCNNRPEYDAFATGIVYRTEQDLTAFLLRWA